MSKAKADKFIDEHVERYGLTGTNVTPNPPKYPKMKGHGILLFSRDNHFIWGYDGESYTNRRSSSSIYYTEYWKASRSDKGSILSIEQELVDTAHQWAELFGPFGVVNRGRVVDYVFIEACREAGVDFVQIVTTHDGEMLYPYDGRVHTSKVDITQNALMDVADDVVPWLRTRSMSVLQDIAIAQHYEEHVVFPSNIYLENHHNEGGHKVGPPNWALCDAEEDTALVRWDYFRDDRTHVIPGGIWSPELIAAQLNDYTFKKWLAGPGQRAPNTYELAFLMWGKLSPTARQSFALPDWWSDVQAHIDTLHDKGKCNEKWYTPLPALLDRFGITYPYDMDYPEAYGEVF